MMALAATFVLLYIALYSLFIFTTLAADFQNELQSIIELEQEFHHIITLAEEYRSSDCIVMFIK